MSTQFSPDVIREVRLITKEHLLVLSLLLCCHASRTGQAGRQLCPSTTFCQSGTFRAGGRGFVDCHFPVDVNQSQKHFLVSKQRGCNQQSMSDTVLNCEWIGDDISCIPDDRTPLDVRKPVGVWVRMELLKVHPSDAGRYFCEIVPSDTEDPSEACFLSVTEESNPTDTTTINSGSGVITPTDGVTSQSGCTTLHMATVQKTDVTASFATFVTLQVVCVIAATTFAVHYLLYKFYTHKRLGHIPWPCRSCRHAEDLARISPASGTRDQPESGP